jgi:hypothetical protein
MNKTLILAALAVSASFSSAAVTNLGTYTKTTDGNETFGSVFGQTFNYTTGNVYVTFQMTFSNATNPGDLDITSSFGGFAHAVADLFGQNWEQSTIGVTYYDGRNDIASTTITPGTPITMVAKYELNAAGVDGDTIKYWVNPTLGTGTEGTPDDADPLRIWIPASVGSSDLQFRMGNSSENAIEFADVTIYADGDSPFAVVPEPSSTALLGLGGLALILRRRK